MVMPLWVVLLCANASEVNTPKLDDLTKNQMHQLLAKQIVCEEFKQAKEQKTEKPMLAFVL